MALDWKLTVWPATGGASREILRDVSFVLGGNGRGLRLQVTPEGECREAVFSAKGAGIQLAPLSAVQVSYLHLGIWTPIFFGEVRRGGNARDVFGEDYALRGMSRRFEEITLSPGFSTPEQPAHLTVRAIIQDVIASGQLGTPALVQYVETLCPDLGFDCRKVVDAAQQNPAALLKQIAEDGARYGVVVRWGIDPQRRFFARPAKADVRDVTTETPTIKWSPPVAETPVTAVLWYVAEKPDGTWITHKSVSPDAAQYGERIKPISLPPEIDPWMPALGTYEIWSAGADTRPNGYRLYTKDDPQPTFDPVTLTDGKMSRTSSTRITFITTRLFVVVRFFPDPGQRIERIVFAAEPLDNIGLTVGYSDAGLTAYDPEATPLPYRLTNSEGAYVAGVTGPLEAGQIPHLMNAAAYSRPSHQIDVYEFRPEVVNAAMLDGLAQFHYASPAQEPADIETVLFVPPVELPGRVRVVPEGGAPYEHPLEAVEYRITSNGMQMGWLAGQADDPNALAQASLIKRRDGEAVITAVTAQT